jgi:hypothetical protein
MRKDVNNWKKPMKSQYRFSESQIELFKKQAHVIRDALKLYKKDQTPTVTKTQDWPCRPKTPAGCVRPVGMWRRRTGKHKRGLPVLNADSLRTPTWLAQSTC